MPTDIQHKKFSTFHSFATQDYFRNSGLLFKFKHFHQTLQTSQARLLNRSIHHLNLHPKKLIPITMLFIKALFSVLLACFAITLGMAAPHHGTKFDLDGTAIHNTTGVSRPYIGNGDRLIRVMAYPGYDCTGQPFTFDYAAPGGRQCWNYENAVSLHVYEQYVRPSSTSYAFFVPLPLGNCFGWLIVSDCVGAARRGITRGKIAREQIIGNP